MSVLSHLDNSNRIIAAQFLSRHLKWPPHWVEGVLDHLNKTKNAHQTPTFTYTRTHSHTHPTPTFTYTCTHAHTHPTPTFTYTCTHAHTHQTPTSTYTYTHTSNTHLYLHAHQTPTSTYTHTRTHACIVLIIYQLLSY